MSAPDFEGLLAARPEIVQALTSYAKHRDWAQFLRKGGRGPILNAFGIVTSAHVAQLWRWCSGRDMAEGKTQKIETKIKGDALEVKAEGMIRSLEQLIEAAEVDLDKWCPAGFKANTWPTAMRIDDRPVVVRLWQVSARFLPRLAPVVPMSPIKATPRARATPATTGREVCIVIPDTQHGFRALSKDMRSAGRDYLAPMHDRRACDLAVQMVQHLGRSEPATLAHVVLLGDHLDASELSKYPDGKGLEHIGTIGHAARELHWWLAQLVQAAPPGCTFTMLEGNHDARLHRKLTEGAPMLKGLKPAGDHEGAPMLSMRRLLGLDALGIDYVGPYNPSHWLWGIRFTHGDTVRSGGGKTAAALAAKRPHSEIYGHIHRRELVARTVYGPGEVPRVLQFASPGTLCAINGDGLGPPGYDTRPDWQQGIGVVVKDLDAGTVSIMLVPIEAGRAVLPDGSIFIGEERTEEIATALDCPQMVKP